MTALGPSEHVKAYVRGEISADEYFERVREDTKRETDELLNAEKPPEDGLSAA